jgi:hypothetical protein
VITRMTVISNYINDRPIIYVTTQKQGNLSNMIVGETDAGPCHPLSLALRRGNLRTPPASNL